MKHPYKRLMLTLVAALTALAARAALPQPDLIAHIHFAGGRSISANPNFAPFTNEFTSAEALALRRQTADRLAPWLAGWLQQNVGTTVPEGAARLRPLLDDLQTSEWFLEARAPANTRPDVALAIRLDPARAQLWMGTLKAFFPAAAFQLPAGWLLFDSGTGSLRAGDDLAGKLSVPPPGWLRADVNWPRLAQWYPRLKELALPETLFDVAVDGASFHINGRFFYPENLTLKLDPWQVPTNTVRQPLTTFTAVRGFAGWLNSQSWAQCLRLSPPANQLFVWALDSSEIVTYAAVPVVDSVAALQQLNPGLQQMVADRDAHDGFLLPLKLVSANNQTTLVRMPFLAPYIKALTEPAGQFLQAGGFPVVPRGDPLPPKLYQALAAPNLVYYHWEITAARLPAQLHADQFVFLITRHKQIDTKSIAYQWIKKISPSLGGTVTEINQVAPDQLAFARTGSGGFTAFELEMLAAWLGADDFPNCDLKLPPPAGVQK